MTAFSNTLCLSSKMLLQAVSGVALGMSIWLQSFCPGIAKTYSYRLFDSEARSRLEDAAFTFLLQLSLFYALVMLRSIEKIGQQGC